MSETLIKVEGVSKKYCRSLKKSLWYGMQDLGRELTGRPHGGDGELRPDEFWAVKDVSFELKRGECLGLIGRNGAGKTTLLKMLNGLIKPDTGRIEMHGRIGAIIALGAGFNPVLTGRENIYVNASIMGVDKTTINEMIEDVIEFSGIRDFIDSPFQTYSSGMQIRLGFAASTILNPDVLILDEVLAVGDIAFRHKCYQRIDEMRSNSAVIFVSHDMANISRICNSAILLHEGRISFVGSGIDAGIMYEGLNSIQLSAQKTDELRKHPLQSVRTRIVSSPNSPGDSLGLEFNIKSAAPVTEFNLYLNILDYSGAKVASLCRHVSNHEESITAGANRFALEIESIPLRNGNYTLGLIITTSSKGEIIYSRNNIDSFTVTDDSFLSPSICVLKVTNWMRKS